MKPQSRSLGSRPSVAESRPRSSNTPVAAPVTSCTKVKTRVLTGLVIAQLGICLVFPLIGLIGYFLLRIEGRRPPQSKLSNRN